MGEGGEIGDGGALDAEEMQTGLPWQHLVETINDGDQSIRAMDRAPAHAADTDKPGALDHMRERHCTAFIITGMTSLNDRHEGRIDPGIFSAPPAFDRSEEHTSELQSLMRISYAVFCLKKKNNHTANNTYDTHKTTSDKHHHQNKNQIHPHKSYYSVDQ